MVKRYTLEESDKVHDLEKKIEVYKNKVEDLKLLISRDQIIDEIVKQLRCTACDSFLLELKDFILLNFENKINNMKEELNKLGVESEE